MKLPGGGAGMTRKPTAGRTILDAYSEGLSWIFVAGLV